jgi:tRNA U34 5-carboxymethylaminomethyl modifying GTPase MnmE/TrmE
VWRVILLGRGSVGKSGLVTRLADPESAFDPHYVCTQGYYETRIRFQAAQGALEGGAVEVLMDVVDTSGQESPLAEARGQVSNQCYEGADGALVMFDLSRRKTLQKSMDYMTDVRQVAGRQVHYVFVGGKNDETHKVRDGDIDAGMKRSRREGYNVVGPCLLMSQMHGRMTDFIEPFTMLAREFLGNDALVLVSSERVPADGA